MIFATLKSSPKESTQKNSRPSIDGQLILVDRSRTQGLKVSDLASTFQEAIEKWNLIEASLQERFEDLNAGRAKEVFKLNVNELGPCVPRSYLFADGSSFIQHVKLVRMARKAPLPPTLETVPLIYQGESSRFLSPTEDIPQIDFNHGTDFEGEVGVVTGFVPMGTTPEEALKAIRFVLLINDVSLRGLISDELAQGFGFFQSKPASALSPFCLTPDELGTAWKEGRVHLPLRVHYNGRLFGQANAKEMHFHFGQLIAHVARTRDLQPGTIIGSGTVSNEDSKAGSSCLAEKRMIEQIEKGHIETPFMSVGDTITIDMFTDNGINLFGSISQKVVSRSV